MQLQTVLTAIISVVVTSTMAAKVGDTGILKGLDAGLAGTITVKDNKTLEISGYTLEDASAPALYWWGATNENLGSGWRINTERVSTTASGKTITVDLNNGHTADQFSVVGLWCETFGVNFGQTTLKAPDGGSSTRPGASTSTAQNPAAESRQSPARNSGAGRVIASLAPVAAVAVLVASRI